MKKIIILLTWLCLFTPPVISQNTLDNLGLTGSSPASLAYSLRKLSSTYSGFPIKARRSSDNAEANVNFDASLTPPAISASSMVTFTPAVTVNASLGTAKTGTISSVAAKTGTISVVIVRTGTLNASRSSVTVTGIGTNFSTELSAGDILYYPTGNALIGIVKSIQSNTSLTLNNNATNNYSNIAFKTATAHVSGTGTLFTSQLSVGDRIYNASNTYLGTVTSIASDVSLSLDSRDAVVATNVSFNGTSSTISGSGTLFTTELAVGDLLISNNVTLGIVSSITNNTSLVLATKAGSAVSGLAYKSTASSITFGSFYSGTSVFINTWYDQSGYGRDAIQPVNANQARIVNSGTLYTVNGKTSIEFSTALTSYLITTAPASFLNNTLYSLNKVSAESNPAIPNYSFMISTSGGNGPNNTISHFGYRSSNQYTVAQYGNDQNFFTSATTFLELHTAVKSTIATSQFYRNGVSFGSLSSSVANQSHLMDLGLFSIGYYFPTTSYANGSISEITVFASALSGTERTNMDNNQLSYYNILNANWTGAVDNDWQNTGNWSPSVVPTATSPSLVVIPSGCPRYPIITATSAGFNIIINSGASVTVSSGGKLQISGSLSNGGTFNASAGTIELLGLYPQSFGMSGSVQNLIINNGTGVSMNGNINVSGNLTFTSGNLSMGGFTLTLGGTVTNTVSGGLRAGTNSTLIVTGSPTISMDQSGTYNYLKVLTINGSGQVLRLASGCNLIINDLGAGLTFTAGKLAIGNNTLTVTGAITNTVSGGIIGGSGSNLIIDGLTNRTLSFDQTTPGTTNVLNNFSINTTTSRTVTVNNNLVVNGTLTTTAGEILNLGTSTLSGTLSVIANNGSITTQNTSSLPIPAGKTWGGTIEYNGTSAQTAVAATYNNLTISNTAGATAGNNITVNGVLYLQAANPATTKGTLDLIPGSYILNMGSTATTTGTGDVTGIVRRTTFVAGTTYTFGNQYSNVTFQATGTLPTEVSLKIVIGTAPAWNSSAILRYYDISQTGASGAIATLNTHYLDAELNGNTEANLVFWNWLVSSSSLTEHGRSNLNTTDNWVGYTNLDISYMPHSFGSLLYTLANSNAAHNTWNGLVSTDWTNTINWTAAAVPISTDNVVIPNTASLSYEPTLPASTTISTLTIQSGGVLNGGSGTNLIIGGGSGAWLDNGTFHPGTSTVTFSNALATLSGTSDFYNVTINSGAKLTIGSGTVMRIANNMSNSGTWDATSTNNTVEYNGNGSGLSSQIIYRPNGLTPGYHNLVLSGTGTPNKIISTDTLNITGNLTINSGVTYDGSTNNPVLFVSGNFSNSGTFTQGSGILTLNGSSSQSINSGGSSFTNFKITNTAGICSALSNAINITGTFTSLAGTILDMSTYDFTASTINHSGTLKTSSTSATPLSSGKNWGGTVEYAATTGSQTVVSGTYNNLSLDNASAADNAGGNLTVNGILNLSGSSACTVNLDIGSSYSLTMGASSTTTGNGDISGIITRNSLIANTSYTFGSQYTTLEFSNVGTLPSSVSILIANGSAPTWKSDAIMRTYDIIKTGGVSPNRVTVNLHYSTCELNGNTETNLVLWDDHVDVSPNVIEQHGRSSQNATQKWVGYSSFGIGYFQSAFGDHLWTLADNANSSNTWIEAPSAPSADWTEATHWSFGTVPVTADDVLIPSGITPANYPTITTPAEAKTITIDSGAILNGGSTLTISGNTGAWNNNGTFNAGSGTVVFSGSSATLAGTTDFYDVTINSGKKLTLVTNALMKIGHILDNSTTGILDATATNSTVEYTTTGGSQAILPASYFNLKLDNSSGTNTAGGNLIVNGTFYLSSGSFSLNSYSLSFGTNGTLEYDGSNTTTLNEWPASNGPINAIINNTVNYNLSSRILSGNLTINNGKLLNINPLATLKIESTVINNNSGNTNLVIQSNSSGTANLIMNTPNIPATVERYISGSSFNPYHYISSPIDNAPMSSIWTNGDYNVYYYDETNTNANLDQGWLRNANSPLENGLGYSVVSKSNHTPSFAGILNIPTGIPLAFNRAVTYTTTVQPGAGWPNGIDPQGWNLVGNPFPCALDAATFITDNTAKLNLQTLYFWDDPDGNLARTPDYASYNYVGGAGTGHAATGGTQGTPNGLVAVGQGFFINVNSSCSPSSTIKFTDGQRIANNSSQFFTVDPATMKRLWFSVLSSENLYNEILIGFLPQASKDYDIYDAIKLKGNADIALYSILNDKDLIIQGLPPVSDEMHIPVGLDISKTGNYTFTVRQKENFINEQIYLKDMLLNKLVDLNKDSFYKFSADSGQIRNRFELIFSDKVIDGIKPELTKTKAPFSIYNQGAVIYIENTTANPVKGVLNIYNMQGKLMMSGNLNKMSEIIRLNQSAGYYLVTVSTSETFQQFRILVK